MHMELNSNIACCSPNKLTASIILEVHRKRHSANLHCCRSQPLIMAVICSAAIIMLTFLFHGLGGVLAAHVRHLLADTSTRNMPSVKSENNQPIQSTQSTDTPQFVHATCAVFLDNSTIFTAESNGATVLYRGVSATVINYASHSIPVPWSFQLSSNSPGYSGIEQAFNFADSRVTDGTVSGTATAKFLTLLPKAANNITIGLLLQADAAAFPVPQAFKLNDHSCSVVVLPSNVPPPVDIISPSFQEVQAEAGTGFTTLKGRIIDRTSGEPISLRGFNWFGFDNAQTCVDGLWAGSTALSRDLATVMRTQQVNYLDCTAPDCNAPHTAQHCTDCVTLTVQHWLHCKVWLPDTVLASKQASYSFWHAM